MAKKKTAAHKKSSTAAAKKKTAKKAAGKKAGRGASTSSAGKKATKKSAAKKSAANKSVTKKTTAKKKTAVKRKTTAKKAAAGKSARKVPAKRRREAPPVEPASTTNMDIDRSIGIGRDAIGNAIISGEGNQVVIYQTIHQAAAAVEAPAEEEAAERGGIGPNPYKGLLAFDENDADRFFGREEQTKRLWEIFRDLYEGRAKSDPPPRLLPVLGPSGSGKSSLARAGLIPEFARRPLPGLKAARVAVMKPASHPLEALAAVLARIQTNDPAPVAKTREFADELKRANADGEYDGLRRIASLLPEIGSSPLIMMIDQFEEVFSMCSDEEERNAFIENLLCATGDRTGFVSAVVTLRTDFLEETQRHARLNTVIAEQGVIIPAMNKGELRRAITEPARLAGHPLDDATVDLLIRETEGREGALPLLQFALSRIWEGLVEGLEPAETLQKIGGVGGALAGEAERIYSSLDEAQKDIARRLFLGLVQLGEGTRDTRRRAHLSGIGGLMTDPDDVREVVQRFSGAGARLISVAADESGQETAEVTHESLFEHWDQMRQWLDEGRDDLRFLRRLDHAARHWDEHDRAEGLLWRPPDLDLLEAFQERSGGDMSPLQLDFFLASKKAEEERIAEKLRQQQRLRRRFVVAASAAVVAFIFLGVAAIAAYFAQKNATEANENFLLAHGTLKDFFTEFSEKTLLNQPGMTGERKRLLEEAIEVFSKFTEERQNDPKVQEDIATTHYFLGSIHAELGHDALALASFRNARQSQERLVKRDPKSAAYLSALATTLNAEGNVLLDMENIDGRLKATLTNEIKSGAAKNELPADPSILDLARAKYVQSEGYRKSLFEKWPKGFNYPKEADQREYQRTLANVYMNIGNTWERKGDVGKAREQYQLSQSKRPKLDDLLDKNDAELDDLDLAFLRDLGKCYLNLARLPTPIAPAEAATEEVSYEGAAPNSEPDPTAADADESAASQETQNDAAETSPSTDLKSGETESSPKQKEPPPQAGDDNAVEPMDDAATHSASPAENYEYAIKAFTKLLRRDSTDMSSRYELAKCYWGLARILAPTDTEKARNQFDQARRQIEFVAVPNPTIATYQESRLDILLDLIVAEYLLLMNDPQQQQILTAIKERYQQAKDVAEILQKIDAKALTHKHTPETQSFQERLDEIGAAVAELEKKQDPDADDAATKSGGSPARTQ